MTRSAFKVNETPPSFMMEYAAFLSFFNIFIMIKSIHTVMGNRKSLKGAIVSLEWDVITYFT